MVMHELSFKLHIIFFAVRLLHSDVLYGLLGCLIVIFSYNSMTPINQEYG